MVLLERLSMCRVDQGAACVDGQRRSIKVSGWNEININSRFMLVIVTCQVIGDNVSVRDRFKSLSSLYFIGQYHKGIGR